VRLEFEGGEDFAEENPVAAGATNEVGVLADEAETGALGEIALEDGAGVNVPERARIWGDSIDEGGEIAEAFAEEMMVVVELGVTRHFACERGRSGGRGGIIIIDYKGDDRFGAGKNLRGVEPLGGVAL